MAKEIRVDDVGTVFTATIKDGTDVVDISSASTKQFIFKPENGSSVTKSATFTTDGTDGKIYYTTVADDLSVEGKWKLQAYIVMSTGSWRTDIYTFTVHSNL